mmetsp:Transcript_2734/g.8278  ORF Transcript_2734/g.8278 Transcript_2734/m.8278 type:complete len:227 (+) Transcript_2734:108-788(+)
MKLSHQDSKRHRVLKLLHAWKVHELVEKVAPEQIPDFLRRQQACWNEALHMLEVTQTDFDRRSCLLELTNYNHQVKHAVTRLAHQRERLNGRLVYKELVGVGTAAFAVAGALALSNWVVPAALETKATVFGLSAVAAGATFFTIHQHRTMTSALAAIDDQLASLNQWHELFNAKGAKIDVDVDVVIEPMDGDDDDDPMYDDEELERYYSSSASGTGTRSNSPADAD